MEVKLAKTAGFCFGVKRAVEMVYEEAKKEGMDIYTYGPIIHNEEVVKDLENKGVGVIENLTELEGIKKGTLVIRSHGVAKQVYQKIQTKGLTVVDATCPFVKKIHRIVERESQAGNYIIIIGNEKHPEVEGIVGWCQPGTYSVIASVQEAQKFDLQVEKKLCIVAQTTFNHNKFEELVEIFEEKGYDRVVLNTICNATWERQSEAKEIAKQVDAMIVIGGKTSSNTQKLYEICKKECKNTYYIQTLVDLDFETFQSTGCVGITAGASTPNNIIEEVQRNVRIKF